MWSQASGFSFDLPRALPAVVRGGWSGLGWPSTDLPSPQAHSVFSWGADQRAPLLLLGILEWPSPIQLDDVLPLLGSFGHAKTVLNANASRFGQVSCLYLQQ